MKSKFVCPFGNYCKRNVEFVYKFLKLFCRSAGIAGGSFRTNAWLINLRLKIAANNNREILNSLRYTLGLWWARDSKCSPIISLLENSFFS